MLSTSVCGVRTGIGCGPTGRAGPNGTRRAFSQQQTLGYTPRTNGKGERFIQSCLREWADARPYLSSQQRSLAAADWTNTYNLLRPHAGIGGNSPFKRLNNLLGNDI